MSRVRRLDLATGEALAPPVRLPNGSWRLQGYATRAGVFRYLNPDGSERFEFRPPEEVEKSAAGLTHCVVTHRHPPEGYVTPTTAGQHGRGLVLESKWDAPSMRVPVDTVITDQRLLDALAGDEQELSAGYSASVTEEAGEWEGQPYTHVQRDIQYNHLAVVKRGRAGPECAMRLDAEGHVETPPIPRLPVPSIDTPAVSPSHVGARVTPPSSEGMKEQPMEVEVEVDGVTFKVPAALAERINALKAKLAEKANAAQAAKVEVDSKAGEVAALKVDKADLLKDKAALTARADAAEGKAKDLEVRLASETSELEKVKKLHADAADPAKVAETVKARVSLITRATPVLGANYDFTTADTFKVHCDALDKLLEGKEDLKKMAAEFTTAKDERSMAVLFNTEMARFDAAGGKLGTPHAPPGQRPGAGSVDPYAELQKKLQEKQRKAQGRA